MKTERLINAFAELGQIMRDAATGKHTRLSAGIIHVIEHYHKSNTWFTPENVRKAVQAIGNELTGNNLNKWLEPYPLLNEKQHNKCIALIPAGNIPAVGFHDILCVLITGNRLIVKQSTKDNKLLPELTSVLCKIEPELETRITYTDNIIKGFDAVIATGSNNTSRYFQYRFRGYPALIRKNRTGIALLSGNESNEELTRLGDDVFTYFGMGCRSISRLFVPRNYDLGRLTKAWDNYSGITDHSKYASNYRYHKAVMTVNGEKFTDTGFILLRRNPSIFSPIAVLNYEETDPALFAESISPIADKIQVITGPGYTGFGRAQKPRLWDYSDNIDTIAFLLK